MQVCRCSLIEPVNQSTTHVAKAAGVSFADTADEETVLTETTFKVAPAHHSVHSSRMGLIVDQTIIEGCLDAVFDAALMPEKWNSALAKIATLFHSSFVDICSWTADRSHVVGIAHGLDPQDYDSQMLGFWFNRNVWAKESPVRRAGEVISTREMVSREDLRRSEMYHEYLDKRGLHEGLRLSLWVEAESLGDVSLLRPWSQGSFGPSEVGLGRVLLPHLQRAAALARQLSRMRFNAHFGGSDRQDDAVAMIAFDHQGVPFVFNSAAEEVFRQDIGLRLVGQTLVAATPEATRQLGKAVGRATGRLGTLRSASTLRLPWRSGSTMATVVVQPLSRQGQWPILRPPAAIAIFRDPARSALRSSALQQMFRLTEAEAQLALDLLAGLTLQALADNTGRSRNTVRTHLAHVMEKTGTTRQVDLMRLLMDLDRLNPPSKSFL